jgi:hypothetical protein
MLGLGKDFDILSGIAPVADLAAGANTGHRVHLRNYGTLGIVLLKGVASAGTDNVVVTLQEHNAATAGTSQNLAVIDEFYTKSEAILDGDEVWVRTTQAKAATVTLAGASFAALQTYLYFSVEAASLSAGFEWVSVNIADPGSGGTIPGGVLYIATDLKIQARADLLAQPNA